jgi:hypothetical protein
MKSAGEDARATAGREAGATYLFWIRRLVSIAAGMGRLTAGNFRFFCFPGAAADEARHDHAEMRRKCGVDGAMRGN